MQLRNDSDDPKWQKSSTDKQLPILDMPKTDIVLANLMKFRRDKEEAQ
jgi:hypothetical protein